MADTKDKWIRAVADKQNQYNIAQRDLKNGKQFANQKFAKSLLVVADNLDLALNSVKSENLENNAELKTLYDGVKMTETELSKVFTGNAVVKFGEIGDKFDPNYYEAMMQFPDAEKEPNTVGIVMSAGYKIHDRVIRPAKVGVVQAPPNES